MFGAPAIAEIGADATAMSIDRDIRTVLERTESPGATILVIRGGRRVYSRAFGLRDLEHRLPAGLDTHYEIGSITKQFTAAAILQLQAAGKLNIDAKVSTYLPDVPHAAEVTLRELLTHTSGLPDYFGLVSDEEATKPTTFEGLMNLVADKPLEFPPGSRARYSNTGFIVLGHIIEVISGDSYRHYIRTHLLARAGMTRTFAVPEEPTLPTMAVGYRHAAGKLQRGLTIDESYSGSAGDIVTTVDDLEKWNEALAGGKIVSKSDYALMMTPQFTTGGERTGYGFGLFVDAMNGQPRIGHTGGSFGFTAANFYFPKQAFRVIVLTNNADVPEPGAMIADVIFNDLYPDFAHAASRPAPGEDSTATARAKAAFGDLQQGRGDESIFSASLNAKIQGDLAAQLASRYQPYGAPTAFIPKGHRSESGKNWFDYRIEFGPGSILKFSIALDGDGKVTSLGFDGF
jgi:CubicO group peptidase (beta-lactamase class C family)